MIHRLRVADLLRAHVRGRPEHRSGRRDPLARYARLLASLDLRPDDRESIFEEEKLDEARFEELSSAWDAAIEKELSRHRNKLLRDQDAAYVAKLEEERAPIAASDYARMAAAAEINALGPVMTDLHLPMAAWPRIRRVWIQLVARDRKLAALVQSFLDEERSK
ncbi:MAG: hypothetical protein U0441_17225 [Polyangiaceae bacterium]